MRPSNSPIISNNSILENGSSWNLFSATKAATIEQALDPKPEPIGIFFSKVKRSGLTFVLRNLSCSLNNT